MTTNYRLFIVDQTPEPSINPSNALVMGLGTSSARATANVADKNFLSFYFENLATSGDNRGMYLRLYHGGAGGGGEAARIFTTVNNVAAGTAHGAHTSLSFGTSGTVTGLGVAGRNTLHIATGGSNAGTMAAIQAEIWSDGSASDPAGATELSFIRVVNGGNATGLVDVDTDAFLFSAQGFTDAAGKVFKTGAPTTLGASLRVKVGSTTYYLPLYTTQSAT
jgi:hypothetical protein